MRLLVIRTSAMGDVALTTPVLKGMRTQYPDVELVLLTRPAFKPFFSSIDGLRLFFPDLQNRHKGIWGVIRLFKDISRQSDIDFVIDLHDVLRSKLLRFLFKVTGVPVAVIDKGRSEKKLLITGKKKVQLKHSVERYCEVFGKAGFPVTPSKNAPIIPLKEALVKAASVIEDGSGLNIGVAPFAKHKLKMWPEANMVSLLGMISEKYKCRFWLFGGKEDSERLAAFAASTESSLTLTADLNLDEELALMSRLDMMIAMDSSNMHMAALVGTKVISIWGGTDPLSGFGPWMQPDSYSIRIPVEELDCRPCTVYGRGNTRNDFACMKLLTPDLVFKKIDRMILSEVRPSLLRRTPLKDE